MKSYPKDIYISREEPGTDDEWLMAHKEAEDAAEINNPKLVGHYILHETLSVEANVDIVVK